MINSKKYFERLNGDDDPIALEVTDVVNAENVLFSSDEFGRNFQLKGVPSTQLIFYYSSGLNTLGTAVDYKRLRVLFFDHRFNGEDTLYAYDLQATTTYKVLSSNQVVGGFNFSTDFRIDRNARVIGDLILWTDNDNETKCINIEAGIKLNQPSYITETEPYLEPIAYTDVTLIRKPPIFILETEKITDGGFLANFIEKRDYQFCYYYQYKNYQESALSSFSALVPSNNVSETYNAINVKLPFAELIDDYVLVVNICVRYGNTGKMIVIKSYDKRNSYDELAIESHNASSVQLGFTFYDNIGGIALGDVQANTFFHLVPLLSKTIEIARNRCFLANNTAGYDTPPNSSLVLSLIDAENAIHPKSGGSFNGAIVFLDQFKRRCGITFPVNIKLDDRNYGGTTGGMNSLIEWDLSNDNAIGEIPDWAYYYIPCLTKNLTTRFFIQDKASNTDYVEKAQDGTYSYGHTTYSAQDLIGIELLNLTGRGIGYTFNEGDFCKLAFSGGGQYNLPVLGQDGNFVLLKGEDVGTLDSSVNVIFEIYTPYVQQFTEPYYEATDVYEITNPTTDSRQFSTLSGTFNIDVFALSVSILDTNGTITTQTSTADRTAIAFGNIITNTDFTPNGSFTAWTYNGATTAAQLTVNVNGRWDSTGSATLYIEVNGTPVGSYFVGIGGAFHFFSANISAITSLTSGDVVTVILDWSISGSLPFTLDILAGSYLRANTLLLERMNNNDAIWTIWDTQSGWPNYPDNIGQTLNDDQIIWSDVYLSGGRQNGLNVFQPLNRKSIGSTSGSIQKLQLTNKQQEDGTVMLIITDTDSMSAYLQEVQLYKASSVEGLITTDEVIGSINPHRNGQGTINPESVVEYNGTVWWINVLKGIVAQYDNNGVSNISDIKMRRFFDRFGKRYVELGKTAIEALCGFSYISGCVDLTNGLYTITLPQTESNLISYGFHADMNYNGIMLSDAPLQSVLSSTYGSSLKVIRYPGGDIANEFDWETGEADEGSPFPNTLSDLKSIHDANGYDILFTLNMCTKSLPNQLAMLAQWKTMTGEDPKYVELGNEVNTLSGNAHAFFPTGYDYFAACTTWAAAIKAVYPNVKIAICGENKGWFPKWNEVALKVPNIDAIVSHIGPHPQDFSTDGIADMTLLNEAVEAQWLAAGMNEVTSKPIWITEFNYNYDPDDLLTDESAYQTTLFILQKVSGLISANNTGFKIMCLRRLVANEGAILDDYTLSPTTGQAYADFLSDLNIQPIGNTDAEILPSYDTIPSYTTSIQNRFDVYDGQAKTMAFNFNKNVWVAPFLWLPECMEYLGNKLYGFKDGRMWLHNENRTSYNVIYGTEYPQRVCFVVNDISPSAIKDLFDLAIEANAKPNFTVGYSDYPNVQITDLTEDDYTTKQGLQLARWFRDRLSPNAAGTPDEKLYTGDIVECTTPFIMVEWSVYDSQLICRFVNCGFEIARGLTQTDMIVKPKN